MNDRYDGSSIDLERALARYMVERRISRRYLLDRIAQDRRGRGARAGARGLHGRRRESVRRGDRASRRRQRRGIGRGERQRPSRRRSRSPRPSSTSTTGSTTSATASSSRSRPSTRSRSTTTCSTTSTPRTTSSAPTAAATTSRSRSASTSRAFIEAGTLRELDHSLLPNLVNLGAEWADPGLRPGQQVQRAVRVVDDRHRVRHDEGDRQSRPARRCSGTRATASTSR